MKTTVEISDSLMAEARAVAARERNTLRALVEEGLRKVLAERREVGRFRPRKATFRGKGLPSHLAPGSWERIRDSVYEERGA